MQRTTEQLTQLESLINDDFGYSFSGRWGKAEEHSSLVVDREKDIWFWNSKGIRGSVLDYLTKVRGLPFQKAKELSKNATTGFITQEEGFEEPYEALIELANKSTDRQYWYDRCLTDSTINRFRLGNMDGWYLLPIYLSGSLYNVQMRRDLPEKRISRRYRNKSPILFNSSVLKFTDTVTITEGPVDSILLNQEGILSVSHDGGANYWGSSWISYFARVKEIFYIADNDEAGINAASLVAKSLGDTRVKVFRFSDRAIKYDTRDYFKDGGTASELKALLRENSRYVFEGI